MCYGFSSDHGHRELRNQGQKAHQILSLQRRREKMLTCICTWKTNPSKMAKDFIFRTWVQIIAYKWKKGI